MSLLIMGIMTWCVVHLFPSAAPAARQALSARMGNAYRGLFALLILLSLALIVVGWRSALPTAVYVPPLYGSPVVSLLMLVAFVLFVAARAPTNIRRLLRHPQLTSVIVWAIAHLLANGDSRSLALFGSLGAWAVLEIALINRRDGVWKKPGPFPVKADVSAVLIGAVAFAILLYLHAPLFGARPY
jgi:uncharacterized membrane protein